MSAQSGSKIWMIVALIAIVALIVSIVTRPDGSTAGEDGSDTAEKVARNGVQSGEKREKPGEKKAPGDSAASAKNPGTAAKKGPDKGVPAAPEAPPVNADMGMAVAVPAGASPVMVPGAPTPTHMPPHVQADRGESGAPFPFKGKDNVEKYLSKRIDDTGEDKLNKYLAATYVGMTSEPASPVSTTISVGAGAGIRIAYPQSMTEYAIANNKCFENNDGVVMTCRYLDAARTWLYRGAHDATVLLPLRKPPYVLAKAEEIFAKEDANETTSKRYLYTIAGTDFTLVVLQDPDDLKPLGVHIVSPTLQKLGIDSLRCTMTGWEEIDGVMFARRWHVSYRVGEQPSGQVAANAKDYSVVITAIRPGAPTVAKPVPPVSQPNGPMRFSPRGALTTIAQAADSKAIFDAWKKLYAELPPSRLTLEHGLLQEVGPTGVIALIDPRSATRAMAAAKFRPISAQQATARKLFKIPAEAIPAAIKQFEAAVGRAGKTVLPGARLARVLRWPAMPEKPDQPVVGECLVEVQVPVQPK